MSSTMEQLRAIADGRASAPDRTEHHPDAELLCACATYLELCADAAAIFREARNLPVPFVGNPQFDIELARKNEKNAEAKRLLTRLGRMHATTAAGVYAKATIVVTQRGYMAAPRFILSLATDLVNNPKLRASLWPAEAV